MRGWRWRFRWHGFDKRGFNQAANSEYRHHPEHSMSIAALDAAEHTRHWLNPFPGFRLAATRDQSVHLPCLICSNGTAHEGAFGLASTAGCQIQTPCGFFIQRCCRDGGAANIFVTLRYNEPSEDRAIMQMYGIRGKGTLHRLATWAGILLVLCLTAHVTVHRALDFAQHKSNSRCAICQAGRSAAPMPIALYRPSQPQRAAVPLIAAAVWREQTLWHFPLLHRPPPSASRS